MALSVTITQKHVVADEREHVGTLNLGLYTTGGVNFTASSFGLWRIRDLQIPNALFTDGTPRSFGIDWVSSPPKIKVFGPGGTESAAVDLSTMAPKWRAQGT